MTFDWQEIVRVVAPVVGSCFGGPLGAVAARTVAEVLLPGVPSPTEAQIADAVVAASPDQLIALKQADADFKTKIGALGVDLERIAAGDRADARRMRISTGERTTTVMAFLVVGGFLILFGVMLFHVLPDANKDLLNILLGALSTGVAAVLNFFYGSSASSAQKTAILATLASKET